MWLYRLVNSENERPAKTILLQPDNRWYKELKEYAASIRLNIQYHQIEEMSYTDYSDMVNTKIEHKINQTILHMKETKTKLRWTTPGQQQQYLQHGQCTLQQAKTIIRIRLHMISTKCNYKRDEEDTKCRKCDKEDETTEHVLECYTTTTFDKTKTEDVDWLKMVAPIYEEIHELHKNKGNGDEQEDGNEHTENKGK